MKGRWLRSLTLLTLGLLAIKGSISCANGDSAMTDQLLSLKDFSECAMAAGWQKVYLPRSSRTLRLKVVQDCPRLRLRANEEVTVVYHWIVLTSVDVPPSKKTRVENRYMSDNISQIPLLAPDKTKYTIKFSSHPAARQMGVKSSIGVETKANELKLVGVLQQSIAIYSSNHPYMLLQRGYTDTFAYCKFARAQAPEKK